MLGSKEKKKMSETSYIYIKLKFRSSALHEPTQTNFRNGSQIQTKITHAKFGVSRSIGLGAVRNANFALSHQNVHGL
jgi:hypothetical protein